MIASPLMSQIRQRSKRTMTTEQAQQHAHTLAALRAFRSAKADRASDALAAYSGTDPADTITSTVDLISDLLHLVEREGGEAQAVIASAAGHFQSEGGDGHDADDIATSTAIADYDQPERALTARELIAKLSLLDPNREVGIHSNSEDRDVDWISGVALVYQDSVILTTLDEDDE